MTDDLRETEAGTSLWRDAWRRLRKNRLAAIGLVLLIAMIGMVIVGLPYSQQGQMTLDEIVGGSPYGATTIAGGQGQRQPSAIELDGARFQGRLIAETANKLFAA